MVDMWRSSPPTPRVHLGCAWLGRCGCAGWSVLQTALTVGKLSGRVSLGIQHPFSVFLEGLPCEDFGVQIGGVHVSAHVPDGHIPGAAQLSHLEQFAIYVATVRR